MAGRSLNQWTGMGYLTRDFELKYTPKGTALAQSSMALNHSWESPDGEKREEVTFIEIEFWGKAAEIVAEYCKKGKPLCVSGRLKQDTWEDKETGAKRSKIKVVGESFHFVPSGGGVEGREKSEQGHSRAEEPQPDAPEEERAGKRKEYKLDGKKTFKKKEPAPVVEDEDEDNIPF